MAVGDAYVFPGFLTPVLILLFFQSHRLLFSHASAEVRGENTPERKVASTWDRTHNHQVMSPTRSPLSHPGGSLISFLTIDQNFMKLDIHLVHHKPQRIFFFPSFYLMRCNLWKKGAYWIISS